MTAAWEAGRRGLVYGLVTAVGIAAFVYPFWLPKGTISADAAHAGDAPLVAALVGLLALAAVGLEVRRGTMNGSTVALLGVLAASAGMLKLLDLPGGGNGMFFLLVLGGAAFGPRFGFLLGLASFAVGAVITGGIGPWLPFQMLTLAWMGAGAGLVGRGTRHLPPLVEVVAVALYGWVWGFVFGAVMNLWFWPWFAGDGELAWHPGLGVGETLHHYWSFYVATSLAWDAAAASTNALVVLLVGRPVLRTLRRFAHRLDPVVELEPSVPPGPAPAQVGEDVVGVR
ncbi:MAG: ECF transporter S component [Acidimicrobiia bacterium]|nr:ECF transporter S component [Acidimicrobiia bacterium]